MMFRFPLFLCSLLLLTPVGVFAQDVTTDTPVDAAYVEPTQEFMLARIQTLNTVDASAKIEVLSGTDQGEIMTITVPEVTDKAYALHEGEKIIITKLSGSGAPTYYVTDHYRLPSIYILAAIFVFLTLLLGRLRGLTSLIGLVISAGVIVWFVVPRIVAGNSPVLITIIASSVILLTSIYLAHGFNKRTSVAVVSTIITLIIATGLASGFVNLTDLFGMGSDEVLSLQMTQLSGINFRGLLLGGMILGALGVLDDITTAQSAAIEELKKANGSFGFNELYKRGISIGKEHITSLVNTLFLAYAGASLPLFLFFTVIPQVPLWVHVNSEFVAEEIVRTLVGSMALILAVPITTALAAYVFSRTTVKQTQ